MPRVAIRPGQVTRKPSPWWRGGIIYQIYVRSFLDTSGDGVGDLPGVIARLDYIKSLGVDAIWLSPVTVTGNADWGYDVIDYCDIDPSLGTMADFERLVKQAERRGLRIILDLVPNHTSTQHRWFQNALTGRSAVYRDYYIWANPRRGGGKPSNWKSYFGGSAWTYHAPTGQYYLHNFLPAQAELNWRNPKVVAEFDMIMKFWLDKGVAGFRVDVFNMLIKDARFRDNPSSRSEDGLELRILGQRPVHNISQPELHRILRHWRRKANSYSGGRLLLGETTLVYEPTKVADFYGNQDEMDLAFNFSYTQSPFRRDALRAVVESTDAAISNPDWPVWTNSNHDQSRFPTRWAGGDERKIRCAMMMLMTLEGTPVLYYGDELGMPDTFVPPWKMKDPVGRRFWPLNPGRDRARTPMPWRDAAGAGFTKRGVRPWLPFGDLSRSVSLQERRKDSTLKYTRDLISVRKQSDDLKFGWYETIHTDSPVWMWRRGDGTIVAINMSDMPSDTNGIFGQVLIGTARRLDGRNLNGMLHLEPWEGAIVRLAHSSR